MPASGDDRWEDIYKRWMREMGYAGFNDENLSDYIKKYLLDDSSNPDYNFEAYIHKSITLNVDPDDEKSLEQAIVILTNLLEKLKKKKSKSKSSDENHNEAFHKDFTDEWA
jgi:hypothetical protein